MIKIIKKVYIEEKDIIDALKSLINIYSKSVENIQREKDASLNTQINKLNKNIEMVSKVIDFVKKLNLKKLNTGYTYNLRVKEIDKKYYHMVTLEKINQGIENDIIEEYVTDVENI